MRVDELLEYIRTHACVDGVQKAIDDEPRNLLGKGSFGEVRKVYWRKTPAAAKGKRARSRTRG